MSERVDRRRLIRTTITALVVGAAAILGVNKIVGDDPPKPSSSLDCLPWHRPTTVKGINDSIAKYRSVPGFLGADVGADATLQGGRSLWVFADTLRPASFSGPRFVRNSMLLFSNHCASVVIPKDHGPVIPDRADGVGYWPMGLGVVPRAGFDIVGVSTQRVRTTGKGAFDFETLGPSVALFKVPLEGAPELLRVRDLGPDSPTRTRPTWGAAITVDGPWLYVYGTANPEKPYVFGWSLQVARMRILDVADPSLWRYWDGTSWQRQASKAKVLIPAQGGVSQILSVFHQGESWYAVSKKDEFLGTDLVIWKAPAPTGPFVASGPLAKIPSNADHGLLRYMPLAHPDLPAKPGQIVVSYSRNVADLAKLAKDPTLYRPKFLEVPLP